MEDRFAFRGQMHFDLQSHSPRPRSGGSRERKTKAPDGSMSAPYGSGPRRFATYKFVDLEPFLRRNSCESRAQTHLESGDHPENGVSHAAPFITRDQPARPC